MGNFWEEFFYKYGPFSFGLQEELAGRIKYSHTETSHTLCITIGPDVKKEEVKVRLKRDGVLEIEWPRSRGEEIPVEWDKEN